MSGNENYLSDLFLLFVAAVIGGLVGGSVGFVLARYSAQAPSLKTRLFAVRKQKAKVLPFRKPT